MRIFPVVILFLLLSVSSATAQKTETWEDMFQELMDDQDLDEEALDEAYERMAQLARSPIDLNSATREDLEQLPFLTAMQVEDLLEYCHRYGPVRSLRELKMIRSLDQMQLELLSFFLFVADDDVVDDDSQRRDSLSYRRNGNGNHAWKRDAPNSELTLNGRIPFYDRHGDNQGYLGYKYRHSLRYDLSVGDKLKAGLIGAQDAGEPFFANKNRWGYDSYSYYVQLSKMGIVDKAIVGKFKVSAGMGLVLGNSLVMDKLTSLQSLGRQPTTLRPHSSRSQTDYFRGAAATVNLMRKSATTASSPLTLTAFVSHRPMDATLAADGTATTLNTNGYHRTEAEMERKDNTHLTAWGGRVAYSNNGWKAGINGVMTHLDRELRPSQTQLFRRHYPAGTDFANVSADYSYTQSRLYVGGETAINRKGAVATVNSVGWQPRTDFSVMALYRFYSYRYNGLYSHSFGDNASAQNESGVFLGAKWNPVRNMQVWTYADYAYFPWARYLVSQSSRAYDFFLQTEYRFGRKWRLLARGRARLRQRDNEGKTALTENNEYRGRLALTYAANREWNMRTQVDATRAFYLKATHGWMASQQLTWQGQTWMACATAAYFDTDDYASRIYLYERLMAYDFYFPSYFGQGIHLALMARKDISQHLRVALRLAYTNYFDRATIGTGLQQIDHSHTTDLDLQLRWRF